MMKKEALYTFNIDRLNLSSWSNECKKIESDISLNDLFDKVDALEISEITSLEEAIEHGICFQISTQKYECNEAEWSKSIYNVCDALVDLSFKNDLLVVNVTIDYDIERKEQSNAIEHFKISDKEQRSLELNALIAVLKAIEALVNVTSN